MFTIKWMHLEKGERLYQGHDIHLFPTGKFIFIRDDGTDDGTECSMDCGIIFVMNESGQTVAKYDLDEMNSAGTSGA